MSQYYHSSPPFDVEFLGFRGNSVELQRRGWDFSMSRDLMYNRTQIAMRNQQIGLYALQQEHDMPRYDQREIRRLPALVVNAVAPEIRIHSMKSPFVGFHAIDVEPAMMTMEEYKISGADIFRRLLPIAEEKKIYLADAGEMELLQNLMQRQQPKQDEIRERLRLQRLRDEMSMPHQKIEAQIIRLANFR